MENYRNINDNWKRKLGILENVLIIAPTSLFVISVVAFPFYSFFSWSFIAITITLAVLGLTFRNRLMDFVALYVSSKHFRIYYKREKLKEHKLQICSMRKDKDLCQSLIDGLNYKYDLIDKEIANLDEQLKNMYIRRKNKEAVKLIKK